jgi:hypothetical protein
MNQLLNERVEGDTRIRVFADEAREKRTAYDGHTITYTDWQPTRTWENRQTRSVRTEHKSECEREERKQLWRTKKGDKIYWLFGPRSERQEPDGIRVKRYMVEMDRTIETDFDGNVSYGEWRGTAWWTREFTEK